MSTLKFAFSTIPLLFTAISSAADGRISKVDLGTATTEDRQIVNPATVFTPDTPIIYCTWRAEDVTPGASIRSVWIAEDTYGAAPANYKIDEASVAATTSARSFDGTGSFKISRPTKGWPMGRYRLEMYIDHDLALVIPFTIAKGGTTPPARILQAELGTGRTDDLRLQNPGSRFPASTAEIVCAWKAEGVTTGDAIRAVWIAEDTGGANPPNFEVVHVSNTADASFDGAERGGSFTISRPPKGWAPGRYRLEIYLRSVLAKTVPFTITAH
jgi:hypothetical protein